MNDIVICEQYNCQGIPTRDDNANTHMHHKFCIIDNHTLLNGMVMDMTKSQQPDKILIRFF